MKRSHLYAALAATALLAAVATAVSRNRPAATSGSTAPSPAAAAVFFPTEQLSIVKDVSGAIVNMAGPRREGAVNRPDVTQIPRADATLARFEVRMAGESPVVLDITDHMWSPNAYVPLVRRVIAPGPRCDDAADAIVEALLHPSRAVIQRENRRVSARLRANMGCADAHVEAALLVGTMALREAASAFTDPRRLISRMTAHLAVADAAGTVRSRMTRHVADAVLLTLVGRQRDALETLDTLDPGGLNQPLQSWIRALRTRNTVDWRIVTDADRSTLLEQLELVRAADASLGDPHTLDFFDRIRTPADVPDWGRIVMQGRPGVAAANRFADEAVAQELREAAEVRKDYAPSVALTSAEALVGELKAEPTDGPVAADGTVWVLDWPIWAAMAERHLMSTINARDTYLTYTVALRDEAREFREQVAQKFSGLHLYPLLAITLAPTKDEARPAMAASLALLQSHPELVTHWMWKSVLMKETWAGLPVPIPRLESWFTPSFPSGTVFDANTRPWPANLKSPFTASDIAPYRRAAPYARQLAYVSIGPDYETAPAAVLKKEFGEMAAFNLSFAIRIANALQDDPDAYAAAMEAAVRMGSEHLLDLAEYEVHHDRLDAARSAYERWFATGRDEVAVANSTEWMVRDYFTRGLFAKAAALADRAARTHSARGLITRARLYDWMGDRDAAERYYRLESERYDDPDEILGFLLRHRRQGTEVDALTWKVFPAGIVRVSMPSLREPPTSGVEIVSVGKLGERHALRVNDIVVAVDGLRVQNRAQYYTAKTVSIDPVMRLVLWRDLKYVEVAVPLRYGGLWGSVNDYAPGTRKTPTPTPKRW